MSEHSDTDFAEAIDPEDSVEQAAPEPVETTGHAAIDEALERLNGLDDLEITSHPEEFDAIHRVLRESLANAGRDGDLPESA
ncbi:hypothetical protein ASE12_03215 [Aeromicrobium sp. Root236]|uniref:hypothetical protein n=1 Tax=Aeromicrobium sp. Root236 TaxID=1736498 RepID=UPI0006FA289C|nr:hypothetical protein [Aeromicrobium sp. Root236]KRC63859.1 hypothetical protein ASE12_03215 [Aeromicrobium sp. Root236]